MAKSTAQETTLVQEKICKSCIRFRAEKGRDDEVTTSLYLQSAAYDALGKPKTIKVSVVAG